MIESLITSKTRIKILLKFFLNTKSRSYLRNLESEFGESSNAIRQELNKFEVAGLLKGEYVGNKKLFQANTNHPLFSDIHSILLKHVGLDKIIDRVITDLGNVKKVYLAGKIARGLDSSVIDLILIGEEINRTYLIELIEKVEKLISRKIRYLVFTEQEFRKYMETYTDIEPLLILQKD
ncbi:MAG: ArsR family transcriptional regulator [Bacteroidales bacterium]|nr:ArsR family transcriptional regulator [Bacteroidales bacterium]